MSSRFPRTTAVVVLVGGMCGCPQSAGRAGRATVPQDRIRAYEKEFGRRPPSSAEPPSDSNLLRPELESEGANWNLVPAPGPCTRCLDRHGHPPPESRHLSQPASVNSSGMTQRRASRATERPRKPSQGRSAGSVCTRCHRLRCWATVPNSDSSLPDTSPAVRGCTPESSRPEAAHRRHRHRRSDR